MTFFTPQNVLLMANCVLDKIHDLVIFPLRNCSRTRYPSWPLGWNLCSLTNLSLRFFHLLLQSSTLVANFSESFFPGVSFTLLSLYSLSDTFQRQGKLLTASISISISSWSSPIFIKSTCSTLNLIGQMLLQKRKIEIPAFVKHFNHFYVHKMPAEYVNTT